MNRRRTILLLALAAMLAVTMLWTYDGMAERRRIAATAGMDLAECRKMAAQIQALRRRPALAAQNQRASAETIGLIEKSGQAAGIAPTKLVQISPEGPRRLGDTVYTEKPTRILLKNVTLQELTALTHRIVTDENRLNAKSMRISAPTADDTGLMWTVELVLTYLIYDPPKIGMK